MQKSNLPRLAVTWDGRSGLLPDEAKLEAAQTPTPVTFSFAATLALGSADMRFFFCVARRQSVQAFCFVAWGRLLFFGVMAAGGTWLNYFASCWAEHHASFAAMLIDVFSLACKEISEGKIASSCQRAL